MGSALHRGAADARTAEQLRRVPRAAACEGNGFDPMALPGRAEPSGAGAGAARHAGAARWHAARHGAGDRPAHGRNPAPARLCRPGDRQPARQRRGGLGMITPIDPAQYRRTPWKNGGGVTIDIAEDDGWRFGRTPITAPGPFSDYTGFDRAQVLVSGCGLVLETPDGEIDVRTPFKPVTFAGETPIVSRLEAGPVEVVNLIA